MRYLSWLYQVALECISLLKGSFCEAKTLLELCVKSLKEGPNRGFHPSLREFIRKQSQAHCVLESI